MSSIFHYRDHNRDHIRVSSRIICTHLRDLGETKANEVDSGCVGLGKSSHYVCLKTMSLYSLGCICGGLRGAQNNQCDRCVSFSLK